MASKETKTLDVPEHEDIKIVATYKPDGLPLWDGTCTPAAWNGFFYHTKEKQKLFDGWGEVYEFGSLTITGLVALAGELLACDFDEDYQYKGG